MLAGTPHSVHTDTDAATEFDMLRVNSSRPEARSTVPQGVATAAALVDPVAVFSRTMMEVATALLARFAIPV